MTLTTKSHAHLHDCITLEGAREHNLQNLSLAIPKRRLTVFVGVSGSGKSSLVFHTLAAEAQRHMNATYSSFIQGFMPSLPRPEVDALSGLTPVIVMDQERLGSHARSTVGTVSEVNPLLRVLFSRFATPHIGPPNAFAFNVPSGKGGGALKVDKGEGKVVTKEFVFQGGMCPRCEGMGQSHDIHFEALFDASKSLVEGALTIPGYTPDGWQVRLYTHSGYVNPHKPICEFTPKERHDFLYKEPTKIKIDNLNLTYEGLIPKLQKSMLSKDLDAMQPHIRAFVERAWVFQTCPECKGTRLNALARSARLGGLNLAEVCALPLSEALTWLKGLSLEGAAPLLERLAHSLKAFVDIGLGYLSLERPAGTLSGGEAQRTKMVRYLGSPLTDLTYVFDEPTVGLHPHDIQRLHEVLLQLRDQGNTVLVIEHKPETMALADHLVELGPKAGREGGRLVFEGSYEALLQADTLTAKALNTKAQLKSTPREPKGFYPIHEASLHNVSGLSVSIPLGMLVVLTGVAGSGKSSLVQAGLAGRPGVSVVDQSPIKGSRRSNLATYTSILEPIRKAFAKAHGLKPALFSANSEGACKACQGMGLVYLDLGTNEVSTVCEACEGRRFEPSILAYRLGDKSIADVFESSVTEARAFFSAPLTQVNAASEMLGRLEAVGLGYLSLGQPLSTLSGGERQRLKLACELGQDSQLVVLDEPTSGLHLADIQRLVGMLDSLIAKGISLVVVEHHLALIAQADWVIDMGPGAGKAGGTLVFEGRPSELLRCGESKTGQYLARYLAG